MANVDQNAIRKICRDLIKEEVTGHVTLHFPKLTAPDTKWKEEGEWRAPSIMGPAEGGALVDQIVALQKEAHAQVFAEIKKAKAKAQAPKLADPSYKMEEDDEGEETGNFIFNFKMKASHTDKNGKTRHYKPRLQNAKGEAIKVGSVSPWGGTVCRVSFKLVPFFVPALGVGVKLELRGVRFIDLVEGGDSGDLGFGDEEEGYDGLGDESAIEDNGANDDDSEEEEESSEGGAEDGDEEEDF